MHLYLVLGRSEETPSEILDNILTYAEQLSPHYSVLLVDFRQDCKKHQIDRYANFVRHVFPRKNSGLLTHEAFKVWCKRLPHKACFHLFGTFGSTNYKVGKQLAESRIPFIFTPLFQYQQPVESAGIISAGYRRFFERWLIRMATCVQVFSVKEKRHAYAIGARWSESIPRPIRPLNWSHQRPPRLSTARVGYIGPINQHNLYLDTTLRFIARTREYTQPVALDIIGQASHLEYQHFLQQVAKYRLSIHQDVTLHQAVSDTKKQALMQQWVAVSLLEENDDYTLPTIQALSAGVPAIIQEHVQLNLNSALGYAGSVVTTAREAAEQLALLIECSDEQYNQTARAAELVYQTRHAAQRTGPRLHELYQRVITYSQASGGAEPIIGPLNRDEPRD